MKGNQTSGIPEPQAYGAKTLTKRAARRANMTAQIMYMRYDKMYTPAPTLLSIPNNSGHDFHWSVREKYIYDKKQLTKHI